MIGQITGLITFKGDKYLIVDVGGVGYKVNVTNDTLASCPLNEERLFWTHLVVREDVLDLYGFVSKSEQDFFELLITVSGIGPKSALGILSLASPEILRKSIVSGNTDYLTKVSGIGKKNAEKIVLELKDKLGNLGDFLSQDTFDIDNDVLAALQALGYSAREAAEAIKNIPDDTSELNDKIRAALRNMERPR